MKAIRPKSPSMSKSGLMLSPCLWWARPEAEYYKEEISDLADTSKRDNGTNTHNSLDRYLKSGHQKTLLATPETDQLVRHGVDYIEQVLLPGLAAITSEQAVAVNWLTGETKYLPGVTGRDYPNLGHDWQCGTADVVGITHNGALYVGDWKTGTTEGSTEQLLSLAYGFSKLFDKTPPVIVSCLSVNEDGVWPHEQEVSPARLDLHSREMAHVWLDKDAPANARPYPGIHCTTLYCPHLAYCSAIDDATRALAAEKGVYLNNQLELTDTPSDDNHAGFVQAMCSAAKRKIEYLTNANKNRIRSGSGKVSYEGKVWEDRGNGFRWYNG